MYDGQKTLLAALDYTPYGQPDAWRGNAPEISYTGHYWDSETGMYFAPFRYLMPGQGRWSTRDPIGMVDSANLYGYVGGRPTRRIDLLGLSWWNPFTWSNPFEGMKWSSGGLGDTIGCMLGLDSTPDDIGRGKPNLPPVASNPLTGPAMAMVASPKPARRALVKGLRPLWQPIAAKFTTKFGMKFAGRFLINGIPVVGSAIMLGITAYEAGKCAQKHMR